MGNSKIEINFKNVAERREEYGAFYECTNCKEKNIFLHYSFCPDCGKEIKWVEDDDDLFLFEEKITYEEKPEFEPDYPW